MRLTHVKYDDVRWQYDVSVKGKYIFFRAVSVIALIVISYPKCNPQSVIFFKSHLKREGGFTPQAEAPRNGAHFLSASLLTDGVGQTRHEAARTSVAGSRCALIILASVINCN